LNADLEQELRDLPLDVDRIRNLLEQAGTWQVDLDEAGLSFHLSQTVERSAVAVRDGEEKLAALSGLQAALDVIDLVPFSINLIRPQNIVYKLWQAAPAHAVSPTGPVDSGTESWEELLRAVAERLGIRVSE
jgi:hypothetical protein